MNGEKIKPCRRCWDDESKGFPSLRHSALKDFDRYPIHDGTMILDLRISNNCNLACTMCSDHASSLWGKLTKSNRQTILSQKLQDNLIANSDKLIKLSIQGGEPFYGDEFVNFVERLQNKSNMQLEMFSNTITANVKLLRKWTNEFKQVSFISSADGVEEVFESIRWPASWDKFERKIKQLDKIKNLGLNFNFTLQNLNILNLRKFIEWRNNTVPQVRITISILEWPAHFHFTVLSKEEKIQTLNSLHLIENAVR
jgi:sulfatase maturation enzyme AslB (radical SAM superfamily)